MKLKQEPEDFQVREVTDRRPGKEGAFAFYSLEKRSLGTPEAVQEICRRWKIEPRRAAYGGLKDRHALTRQFLTIQRGPRRDCKLPQLTLAYLGQVPTPFSTRDIQANQFRIVLRDLSGDEGRATVEALEEARVDGVPNYFDDQRFGSVTSPPNPPLRIGEGGRGERFVARKLVEEDYEAALRLALIEPYEFDRSAIKAQKRLLTRQWGNWTALSDELPQGDARRVVAYLVDRPRDFRGAFARLRADLKSLYLAAYQSHLWNRTLAGWLEQNLPEDQRLYVDLQLGQVPMGRHLTTEQRKRFHSQRLPLPSARLKLDDNDPLKPFIESVMQEEGLRLGDMKLKHFRQPFFSRGEREAFFLPADLKYRKAADERHAGKQKLQLEFELPRGAYGTLLVKRITAAGTRP
jgi:tRNA pseudouridine13 synthase